MYFIPLKGLYFSPYMSKRFTFSPKSKQTETEQSCLQDQQVDHSRCAKSTGSFSRHCTGRREVAATNCQNPSYEHILTLAPFVGLWAEHARQHRQAAYRASERANPPSVAKADIFCHVENSFQREWPSEGLQSSCSYMQNEH